MRSNNNLVAVMDNLFPVKLAIDPDPFVLHSSDYLHLPQFSIAFEVK